MPGTYSMLTRLFNGSGDARSALLAIIPTIAAAWLVARVVRRLAVAGLRRVLQDNILLSSPLVRAPLRLLGAAAFVLVVGTLLFPALQLAGLHPRTGMPLRTLADWAFGPGLKVILIVINAYALVRLTALLVRRFEHDMNRGTTLDALELAKRAKTLGTVVQNATVALVVGIALLMILSEFGLNITPVLTGAGIAGLALGFGAQTLVRDIISGFFLILEDQVRVGDVAAINGTAGLVETINLRTIVLRDVEGAVHVFPNGAINTLSNRTKDFSYYVVDVSVSYYEDVDRVTAVLREVGAGLQSDPVFGPWVLAPIEVLGVDDFTDWAVRMKARIKTVPLKQWEVGRELRRRILNAFRQHGFAIPFPVPRTAVRPDPVAPSEGS
ncbi:MAG: mechanosensitive ion channel family protein [Acidobacteriota bacterium]